MKQRWRILGGTLVVGLLVWVLTGGVFLERFDRYHPVSQTLQGQFEPNVTLSHKSTTHTLLPFLFYQTHITFDDAITIQLEDPTTSKGYEKFRHVIFDHFHVRFASKEYYTLPVPNKPYRVCSGSYASCEMNHHHFMEWFEIKGKGSMEVSIQGTSVDLHGTEQPFIFTQQWEKKPHSQLITMWHKLGRV